MAPLHAVDSQRPLHRYSLLAEIFPKMSAASMQKWGALRADLAVAHGRANDNALLGMILMACTEHQLAFLSAVYDELALDDDLLTAFKSLIRTGRFIDVMDHTGQLDRQRVLIAYSAVMEARGKL